jgi:hypothetical protein
MPETKTDKVLELILKAIAAGGELAVTAIEAYREIKSLTGKSDDELMAVWVSTAEANEIEIVRRRLEIAGLIEGAGDVVTETTAEMSDN